VSDTGEHGEDARASPASRLRADQVVTVFRSRRRPGSEAAYSALAEEMAIAARASPGFVDFKTFDSEDGEHVTVATFADLEAQRAWREDPRHVRAQQRGRDELYLEYSIQVGRCEHVTTWALGAE
jgi:heme-degrading monooxygenase HmoA